MATPLRSVAPQAMARRQAPGQPVGLIEAALPGAAGVERQRTQRLGAGPNRCRHNSFKQFEHDMTRPWRSGKLEALHQLQHFTLVTQRCLSGEESRRTGYAVATAIPCQSQGYLWLGTYRTGRHIPRQRLEAWLTPGTTCPCCPQAEGTVAWQRDS